MRYRDIRQIGDGGFGTVWLCERESDKQRFARKRLHDGAGREEMERFHREVRILSNLDHPNVIHILGYRLSKPPYWYVMPLYKRSLEDELANLIGDEDRIHDIFTAILDAVEYAHSEGVIHRDLKPQNVLLNSDDDVVVTDFGIGRMLDSESTRKTYTGEGMGSFLYMAPEQVRDAKNADERSDIFSLGRILYELYTEPLTSAPQDTSAIDPAVAHIVDRCTKRDPEDRYQSVETLKEAWLTAIGLAGGESPYDDINQLIKTAITSGELSDEDAGELLDLLFQHSDDSDVLHESIMKIPAEVICQMCSQERGRLRSLVRDFAEHTAEQPWAFSYTDKIGNHCRSIYEKCDDPQVRADMIYCVLKVGKSHNRWHLWKIFADLIQRSCSTSESLAIRDRLANLGEDEIEFASEHASPAKLHGHLRSLLFPERSDEEELEDEDASAASGRF